MYRTKDRLLYIQGVSSQTVESNLALREGWTNISDILTGNYFQGNLGPF